MQRVSGGWAIINIRGNVGFQEDVLAKLRDRYLSGSSETDSLMMVWVPDGEKLQSLKLAVGSKMILKYRLHFFSSLNRRKAPDVPSVNFPFFDKGKTNQMTVWQKDKDLDKADVFTE